MYKITFHIYHEVYSAGKNLNLHTILEHLKYVWIFQYALARVVTMAEVLSFWEDALA